ncbi:MAG: hypothetical protein ACK54C_14900 [Betaproteobacteria bacterium]|jgi:hypothetical protein
MSVADGPLVLKIDRIVVDAAVAPDAGQARAAVMQALHALAQPGGPLCEASSATAPGAQAAIAQALGAALSPAGSQR